MISIVFLAFLFATFNELDSGVKAMHCSFVII